MSDMGPLPLGFTLNIPHLNFLNISGNHLDNNSLHIINALSHLEVGILLVY